LQVVQRQKGTGLAHKAVVHKREFYRIAAETIAKNSGEMQGLDVGATGSFIETGHVRDLLYGSGSVLQCSARERVAAASSRTYASRRTSASGTFLYPHHRDRLCEVAVQ
jgi:hypothetical protein